MFVTASPPSLEPQTPRPQHPLARLGPASSPIPEYFCVRRGLGYRWKRLPMAVRSYAQRFVAGGLPEPYLAPHFMAHLSPEIVGLAACATGPSPPRDATELVVDLRCAFPTLARRLVDLGVASPERLVLRFECEGAHDGPWRGLVCATRRYVVFEERHELTLDGRRVASDEVFVDLAAITRQLCGL
jgi:SnoaL-like polyketide cyclase